MIEKEVLGGQGYVKLLDVIPSQINENYATRDYFIVKAAMYSTFKSPQNERKVREMISKLFKWGHYSPFEQAVISLEIKAPTVVFWQLDRHRTFRYASHLRRSGRYTEFEEDEFYIPEYFSEYTLVDDNPLLPNKFNEYTADVKLKCMLDEAMNLYKDYLDLGMPKESARYFLPAWCMLYTEVMNVDLKNLMHFLALRMDSHAQREIREYASAIHAITTHLFPYTMAEFDRNMKPINYDFEGE